MNANSIKKVAPVLLDGKSLTIEDVIGVSRNFRSVHLDNESRQRVKQSSDELQALSSSDTPIYGVNTGFGIFANKRIEPSQSINLSRNLILSHAVGIGSPFAEDVVRAAMLIRANTLSQGRSGVRAEVIDTLLSMLNAGVTPYIPSKGSLGSSGDLAPLAHLALTFTKCPDGNDDLHSGKAWYKDQLLSGAEALEKTGISPLVLQAKEGLAITNGATFATALLALAYHDAFRLLQIAEIGASLSIEALLGVTDAFDERLHSARPHPGQISVASRLSENLKESTLVNSTERIQDAYSLRCTPQVLGPAWDLLEFIYRILEREVNSITDNPLIFDGRVISGGNFHGEPIGLASDYLKIALAEVGAIAERRVYRLTAEHMNEGLPPMLVEHWEDIGLQSGLMMLQYSAAALVLENQALSAPDSVHSLPTSAGQEDHNANATNAAKHLTEIIENLYSIIAIELLTSAQAIDLRFREMPESRLGHQTNSAYQWIRSIFPIRKDDYPLGEDIEAMSKLLHSDSLFDAVEGYPISQTFIDMQES
ncbi:MAG: histidine ammonia-lyase [Anaerolineales bacterium]|nr:histidine ammonia-lyase [Anaerolineales bacterium]